VNDGNHSDKQLKSLLQKDGDTDNEEIKSGEALPIGDTKKDINGAEEEPKKPVNAGRKLMQYAKREWCLFLWGTITLVGGNFGQLVIPYYVGLFTDRISKEKYDEVYSLCWQLVLINSVKAFQNS
jgi:hypothetical protein